jgi:two-component system OmpR family response regulator
VITNKGVAVNAHRWSKRRSWASRSFKRMVQRRGHANVVLPLLQRKGILIAVASILKAQGHAALILIIGAKGAGSDALVQELRSHRFAASYVDNLPSAQDSVSEWNYNAALIDGERLGKEIVDIVRGLRERNPLPILAIFRRVPESLLLKALEAGASQVLRAPASPRLIVAQLQRLMELSRLPYRGAEPMRLGPLRLVPDQILATLNGKDVGLTPTEFDLLLLLVSEGGKLVHRDALNRTLSYGGSTAGRRGADMHIFRIRQKLKLAGGESRVEIEAVYGRGYLVRLAQSKLVLSGSS